MSTTDKSSGDVDSLLERMDNIRSANKTHVADLQLEAGRLVDWREHVRAKPLVSVAVAALVGFSIVNARSKSEARPIQSSDNRKSTIKHASVASNALSIAGSMAGNMIRNYVTNYVRNKLSGEQHDFKGTANRSELDRSERNQFTR